MLKSLAERYCYSVNELLKLTFSNMSQLGSVISLSMGLVTELNS